MSWSLFSSLKILPSCKYALMWFVSFLTIACKSEIALFLSPVKRALSASENRNSTLGVFFDLKKEKKLKIVAPIEII